MLITRVATRFLKGWFGVVLFCLADWPAFGADGTPPSRPSVSDDGRYTSSSTTLHATWKTSDTQSGISECQYLIRRGSASGKIVVKWTSVGLATEVTRSGLRLANGKTYFIGVRAKNGEGLWSPVGYSDGIKVDNTAPSTPGQVIEGSSSKDAEVDTDGQYTVYWSGASDPESGIAAYELQEQIAGTAGWVTLTTTTSNSHSVQGRLDNTKYFYRVRAKNGAGIWSAYAYSDGIAVETDAAPPTLYQGFGSQTAGGDGQPVYRVTNLSDSGPGSLRAAVSQGYRTVVFDVGGEIDLSDHIYVSGAFITIDGFTAPAPGISLKNRGLHIHGTKGAHDIIVRGIRVRNSSGDGMQVRKGGYNVVFDHVSIQGSGDGNLDITEDSRDVTVSWSILAEPGGTGKTMLIKYNPAAVSLHHNLFVKGVQRNPHVRIDDSDTPATALTLDMRNNVVWNWAGGYGAQIWHGARANIVNNFFANPDGSANDKAQAIIICNGECSGGNLASPARAYLSGNYSADGINLDIEGTEQAAFAAPPIDTTDALTACDQVLANAGVRPLDSIDEQYLSLVSCP